MKLIIWFVFSVFATLGLASEPQILPLWPGKAPGTESLPNEELVEDRSTGKPEAAPNRKISRVTVPSLLIFRPASGTANHAAVIICPGGGYSSVGWDKEGLKVAEFLSGLGYTAAVLKYRMPRPDLTATGLPWPQQDAQRAIRLLRAMATEYDMNQNRIGIMGFSAGGHLAATCGVLKSIGDVGAHDPIDRLSARPDFLILVYPVVSMRDPMATHPGSKKRLLGENPPPGMADQYSPEIHVNAATPPTFLVHAKDDRVSVENSILFVEALKQAGVSYEFCLLETGGHGFGLAQGKPAPLGDWPTKMKLWLEKTILAEAGARTR